MYLIKLKLHESDAGVKKQKWKGGASLSHSLLYPENVLTYVMHFPNQWFKVAKKGPSSFTHRVYSQLQNIIIQQRQVWYIFEGETWCEKHRIQNMFLRTTDSQAPKEKLREWSCRVFAFTYLNRLWKINIFNSLCSLFSLLTKTDFSFR